MRITRLATTGATVLTLAAGAPALAKDSYGSPGPDRLVGTDRKDTIRGYEGNDKIFTRGGRFNNGFGGAGRDRLVGGPGDDYLIGGPGDDRLRGRDSVAINGDMFGGGLGDDVAHGGRGPDGFGGGKGDDVFYGGKGRDSAAPATGTTRSISAPAGTTWRCSRTTANET